MSYGNSPESKKETAQETRRKSVISQKLIYFATQIHKGVCLLTLKLFSVKKEKAGVSSIMG